MASGCFGKAGKAPAVEHVHTAALYDHETGKIAHLHSVVTFEGGARYSDEQVEAAARRHASRRHADPDKFGVVISHDPEHSSGMYRIDLKSKTFVALPSRRTR